MRACVVVEASRRGRLAGVGWKGGLGGECML